jgi:hypothetical protein
MSKNITDNNLVADAKSVLKFWEEHSDIKLLETNCAQFKKAQNAFQGITDEIAHKEIELSAKMTERDQLAEQVRLVITRLRSGVRSFYGPDSKEYEQVGGTRASTRKRIVRSPRRGNLEAVGATNGNGSGNGNGNGHADGNGQAREIETAA